MAKSDQAEKIWQRILTKLQPNIEKKIFKAHFKPIRALEIKDSELLLEPHDSFEGWWVSSNYTEILGQYASEFAGRPLKVQFVGEGKEGDSPSVSKPQGKKSPSRSKAAATTQKRHNFNPDYTFSSFIVGDSNRMVHASATAASRDPGKAYNPLYIYGGVGLGKTHLLHAIGNHVIEHKDYEPKVTYLSCEKFINDFIEALKNNRLTRFRTRYRSSDVLLLDDVQFLSGKERTQEEFFHTFNALYDNRKQIVMTCDTPASEIKGLEKRLVSRFEWGMTSDLQPPDTETRLAILRKKAMSLKVKLPDEIYTLLADRICNNIRRLEGALTRVAAYSMLNKEQEITEASVTHLLQDVFLEEEEPVISIQAILKAVANHFDIRIAEMIHPGRKESIAFPRQIAMYLCRKLTNNTYVAIGEAFGGRKHGTVLHAERVVRNRIDTEDKVKKQVGSLEKQMFVKE